jgi:hypothetical protein
VISIVPLFVNNAQIKPIILRRIRKSVRTALVRLNAKVFLYLILDGKIEGIIDGFWRKDKYSVQVIQCVN